MFFLAASFFSASYNADGILIFNALSFTFSPPLQFYYNYCYMSTVIFHNLSLLFLLVLPSLQNKKLCYNIDKHNDKEGFSCFTRTISPRLFLASFR